MEVFEIHVRSRGYFLLKMSYIRTSSPLLIPNTLPEISKSTLFIDFLPTRLKCPYNSKGSSKFS